VARAASLFVLLMVFWVALSQKYHLFDPEHGSTDRFLTACGVASCLFTVWYCRRHKLLDEEGHPLHLALRGWKYIPWLFWQIVLSNWDVMKRVWSPRRPIDPCLVRVPYTTKTDLGTVIYANSITLTPGTVTIDIDPQKKEFLVHCLTHAAGEDLKKGGMDQEVRKLEGTA
jgi:multicomponent Na+:H+ antiporter subunit E